MLQTELEKEANQSYSVHLTFSRPIEFSIKLCTIKLGWSIVYIEGVKGYNFQKYCISFSEDRFLS